MEVPVIINNRAYTQGKNILQYWDYTATSISNQYYAQLEFKKSTDSAWIIEKERDYSKTHKYENLEGNTRYDLRIKAMYDYLYSYEDGADGDIIDVQAESYTDVTPATQTNTVS